jgi:hypothetical protein
VDELDLVVDLPVLPPARAALRMMEWTVGVAYLRRGRLVSLLAAILWQVVITSPVVVALVVLAATSVVAAVVDVAM